LRRFARQWRASSGLWSRDAEHVTNFQAVLKNIILVFKLPT